MTHTSPEELGDGEGSRGAVSTDSAVLVSTAEVGSRGRNRDVLMLRADAPREPTDDAVDGVGDGGVEVRSLFIVDWSVLL